MVLLFEWAGWPPLKYLIVSSIFAIGLHPLGARWIPGHRSRHGQETYSYYGPLNKVSFNVGYHNEHHDIVAVLVASAGRPPYRAGILRGPSLLFFVDGPTRPLPPRPRHHPVQLRRPPAR
jgi:hypothetical protein